MKKGCLKHRYYPGGLRREKRASGRTLMSYTYDLDGRKISQRNLTGKSTGYAYNRNGMLSQVMENGRCLAAYEYYADGNIKSLRVGTDLITDYAYDLNKNLTTIRTTLGGGSIVCDNKYTYDGNGNRLSKADRQGLTKYAYDANNQLVQVQYPQGGLENYSYDAAGNRLGRSADGIQENYRYDNCNRLIQLTRMTTQQETVTYSYDRQGNMLSDGRNRYAYDDFGRLASTVTAEGDIQKNCYDAEGLRAEMEENGRLVQFLYNEDREVVAEKDYSGNLIRYIRGLGLISSDSENAKTYYHYVSDEQGSVSHIIRDEDKESGVSAQGREQDRILNQYEYDAFGNTISCKEQVENRFRYQGEQYDPITRQYYLRARYYNPVIGRFIQEDTYYGDGLNLYEYCRNNTITYKDPTGHNICPTQRDLYHKYKEEGMSPQEAYQKMRKELGLDSKSGYKDSGVGNGKDPWRSYESGSSSGKVWDYAKQFDGELSNFNDGYEIKNVIDEDLCLVQFHSNAEVGNGRSLKYWTTFDEANGISTVDDYMNKMALLSNWGARDNVSIAKIPAGTKIKYAIGTAKEQVGAIESRPGGGLQILFEQFDDGWVLDTRPLP